jgi:hypothetical protein
MRQYLHTVFEPTGGVLVTEGPYVEGKEHVGGFAVVRADDPDAALAWSRTPARAIGLPIEVRPFRSADGG